jgi:Kdo2-lipid IVA lauroyltransferase/acyltransferase
VHPREGIEVPFFGHPAMTTPVLARLSLRTGAPVVPVFAYPAPRSRYQMVVREPILPPAGVTDLPEAVAALTRRYLAVIEEEIRSRPEMWLWMHRRWDRRPAAEPLSDDDGAAEPDDGMHPRPGAEGAKQSTPPLPAQRIS